MASRNDSPPRRGRLEETSVIPSRQIEAFSRKVQATASHLIAPLGTQDVSQHYQNAIGELHRELRRPAIQRGLWSFAQTTPRDLVRGRMSVPEIQQRALSYVPDDLLTHIPETRTPYSLFQGFQASIPEEDPEGGKRGRRGRHGSRQKLIGSGAGEELTGPPALRDLKNEKNRLNHKLEMLGVRKNMSSAEIYEIDNKIANLNTMRKIVLDRLAGLEQEESELDHELLELDTRIEDMEEELEDEAALAQKSPEQRPSESSDGDEREPNEFMSESIYEKLPANKQKARRKRHVRRTSIPVLHEHMEPGSKLKEIQAHNDMITALDFDQPFGTAVTAALDDTVRVWDLSAGRCMGLLEGHLSSVRCLQVEDNIVATGSMDASIRLWDLSKANYAPAERDDDEEDGLAFENAGDAPPPPPANSMSECPLFTLEAHVAEVTALHFRNETLVSGSSDKTLRQWDLVKGRCVQTLDVLWAAAQASASLNSSEGQWRSTSRLPNPSADFVGALQVFEAALACGTADGMVRLWDLRSGQVHRSLVGHTGPVTALQFDDIHLVTSSLDRSIRIWDLRTGAIHDAFAYNHPVSSMRFDSRRIVAAAGEDVVKVYDKTDGRQWDCGAGAIEHDDFNIALGIVERVALKDGFLLEGRKDGIVGAWSC